MGIDVYVLKKVNKFVYGRLYVMIKIVNDDDWSYYLKYLIKVSYKYFYWWFVIIVRNFCGCYLIYMFINF